MNINRNNEEHRVQIALDGAHKEYIYVPQQSFAGDLEMASSGEFTNMQRAIDASFLDLPTGKAIKIQFRAYLHLEKYSFEDKKIVHIEVWFPSDSLAVFSQSQIKDRLKFAIKNAFARYDSFVAKGSGWSLQAVLKFSLTIMRFKVVRGGCLRASLPKDLRNLRSLYSVSSREKDKCFLYCVAAGIAKRKKNVKRMCKQYSQLVEIFSSKFIHFPVTIKGVISFEKVNPISVNVYGFDKVLYPHYISDFFQKKKYHVNLLLHSDHFYLITNLGRLMLSQRKGNRRKCYVCNRCLSYFVSQKKFSLHLKLCNARSKATQQLMMPTEKTILEFVNFSHVLQAPFVIYADFESAIAKEQILEKGKLLSIKDHKAISWATLTVCRDNYTLNSEPTLYTGEDAIDHFFNHLDVEFSRIRTLLENVYFPLNKMSKEVQDLHEQATECYMCKRPFTYDNMKVRDHCHLNGAFRFSLCSSCNFTHAKLKKRDKVYIFFHGLSNYDSHFIIQSLHKYDDKYISVIPKSSEKYLSFTIGNLQFKDSYGFLSESLATLVEHLREKGEDNFKNVRKAFPCEDQRALLYQKGVFPYNYITCLAVLEEDCLPTRDNFFNDLTNTAITEEQYGFAEKVWSTFNCKKLKDYLNIYLMADCLLLADVFEAFRTNCLLDYDLDPAHYFSSAHFTFDAFLRKSRAKIELITDINMYLFTMEGIRGGLSMVSKRYANANNEDTQNYDPTERKRYIIDLDCNNLYGKAMSDYLPYMDFEWNTIISLKNILDTSDTSERGYIVECTLFYPSFLHDYHNDYPLAPEKRSVPFEELSDFAKETCLKHNLKNSVGTEKLMTTFYTKHNYVLHYRTLKLYVILGMEVKKIHRVLQFTQAPIMRSYIMFNSAKRAEATNQFDIGFYKFLSNSLFGKTMERPENKTKIKLVSTIKSYEKLVGNLNFKSSKIINGDLIGLELKYPYIKIKKPFFLGMSILELAKTYMFDFHYNEMKRVYGANIQLLYTDTDSLLYEIQTDNLEKDLEEKFDQGTFDFSNYSKTHFLYSEDFKRIPGCFKDECAGEQIDSFVGLRSKMYAIKLKNRDIKAAKGVKKSVISQDLKFDSYLDCLTENIRMEHSFKSIRSSCHNVYTSHQSKTTLSSFDDKRWLRNNVDSYAYGHYKINAVINAPAPPDDNTQHAEQTIQ